jgi:hypothetical protein
MKGQETEMTLFSRNFFGIKDDNGGEAGTNHRTIGILRAALERVKELRTAGYSDDRIKDELNAAVSHVRLDLGFLVRADALGTYHNGVALGGT